MLMHFMGQVVPLLHPPERHDRPDLPACDGLLLRWRHDVSVDFRNLPPPFPSVPYLAVLYAVLTSWVAAMYSDGPGAFDFVQGNNSTSQ